MMFETDGDTEFEELLKDLQSNNVTNLKRASESSNDPDSEQTNKRLCLNYTSPKRFENRTRLNGNSPNQQVVLRKFPGPAGLLPEKRDFSIDIKTLSEKRDAEAKKDNVELCSQMSVRIFDEGPWSRASEDYYFRGSDLSLTDKYNIAWIKNKVRNNKLINQKAPFVAAVIQNIECPKLKTAVVTLTLKDQTGQINGTLISDLYEEYINEIKVGSVIVLKQFGVLTTDRASNLYITITNNNLIAIYSCSDCKGNNSEVKVTTVYKTSLEDLVKSIDDVKKVHSCKTNLRKEIMFETSPLKPRSTDDFTNKYNNHNKLGLDNRNDNKVMNKCHNQNINLSLNLNKINEDVRIDNSSKNKFNFKSVKQSHVQRTENTETSSSATTLLENIFEGVDTNELFEDF